MTPSNYQRTRWLTLIGTIITQFALGSVYTRSLFNGAFCQAGCAGNGLAWPYFGDTMASDNLMMLWLSAGVLVGLADGAGYLLTLSNCVKWFPERKGLISAFAIGSYGLGSTGFKFIDTQLLETVGLEKHL